MTVLRYGGDADFRPFEWRGADGQAQGFQVELLRLLGPLVGVEFDVRLGAWPAIESDFRAGQLDVVAMVPTEPRRAWAHFARSHASLDFLIYHRVGTPAPQSIQDLAGRTVAVLEQAAMRETRDHLLGASGLRFLPVDTPAAAVAAVVDERADAAVMLQLLGEPLRAAATARKVAVAEFRPRLQSYSLAVAPGATALRDRLDAALATLEADGRLDALRERWLTTHTGAAQRHELERVAGAQSVALWSLGGGSMLAMGGLGALLVRRSRRVTEETRRRREAESRVARAEALLTRAFTRHPEPMLVTEAGSTIVQDVNDALCDLVGQPREALLGLPLDALSRHVDPQAIGTLRELLARERALVAEPLQLRRADGSARQCLVAAEPMVVDGRPHVFSLLRDVTEARERDESLRRGYDALVLEQQARLAATKRDDDEDLRRQTLGLVHDLKAPLRAVQGFNGLLRGALVAGRIDEALAHGDQIDRAARRMESMLAGLSRLASTGARPLQRRHVDMRALAEHAWQLVSAQAPQRRVEFALAPLPSAEAEPEQADQVWQNLLENAWKYTAKCSAPKVAVESFATGERTWYRITDNGAGFDMARADRLFQPFQRLHTAGEFEGTGVGLSLVRQILLRHGGDIRLRSAVNVGTIVEFTFTPA